jgi:myo-inositol 2-dehydrogenase / D-chiro-inositol 1-dehydrogenase
VDVPPERRFLGFDSYQKVIDSGVDVVILTTYPVFRPLHLAAAVAAGKHVFAEKPVAVDAPGVRIVIESAQVAREKNLALVVGFCWRYNDGMRGMYQQVAAGALGDITSVYTTYLTGTLPKRPRKPEWSDVEFQLRNWWHFNWVSGDHIVEQAVHSIDRLAWATGDLLPTRVVCLGGRAARSGPEHGNVFDHFSATYEYASGLKAFHGCRQIDGCPSDNTDYLTGTRGSGVVNGWAPTYSIRDLAGKEVWRYAGRTDRDMYQTEHDEMFASIRTGRPINDGVRGAHTTLMAVMARMAAYTGQTITWERALNSSESLLPASLAFGDLPAAGVPVPGQTKFT